MMYLWCSVLCGVVGCGELWCCPMVWVGMSVWCCGMGYFGLGWSCVGCGMVGFVVGYVVVWGGPLRCVRKEVWETQGEC